MNPTAQALLDAIPALPKVLLHDHLDGGLRPQTLIELAAESGHELPIGSSASSDESTADAEALAEWFHSAADSGALELYLETFEHTTAVMQTAEALTRIAREAVEDLAADGVVYTEQRWAPELHLAGGLSMDEAVAAVQEGLRQGVVAAAAQGHPIQAYQILCVMRHNENWAPVADLAIRWQDRDRKRGRLEPGAVVGLDLAGPEAGFLPERKGHDIWTRLAQASVPVTIHAGEGDGLASIQSAIQVGRALRLGHGVRLIDDVVETPDGTVELGKLAHWVRDRQIALEVAPGSNLHTRAAGVAAIDNHPITDLMRLGFAVTVNTDNRLMSGTSMSAEMHQLVANADWTLRDLYEATIAAANHAFIHHDERQRLIDELITPGYKSIAETVNWEE